MEIWRLLGLKCFQEERKIFGSFPIPLIETKNIMLKSYFNLIRIKRKQPKKTVKISLKSLSKLTRYMKTNIATWHTT